MNKEIEKAFEIANFMSTLNNQKRILFEEHDQNLFYYKAGNVFKATPELISFISTLIQNNISSSVVLDHNKVPVEIKNLKDFLSNLISSYTFSTNSYYYSYSKLVNSKNIGSILDK